MSSVLFAIIFFSGHDYCLASCLLYRHVAPGYLNLFSCNLKTDHITYFLFLFHLSVLLLSQAWRTKPTLSCLSSQAFEFYNKALRCLAERKKSPEVWDTVTWELSGSYFSMGTLLQDFAPLSSYAQEQVTEHYDAASKCLLTGNSPPDFPPTLVF